VYTRRQHFVRLFVSRGRFAGDVIIIEVNRPPRNEVTEESASGQDDMTRGLSHTGAGPCLDGCDGGGLDDTADKRQRRRDEDIVYVELDVDCAAARRQNRINTSKCAGADYIS